MAGGFWRRIAEATAATGAAAADRKMSSLELFREIYGSRQARSGASVTPETALAVATVLACVRVLADGVAQIPVRVYRRDGAARHVAADHGLHETLTLKPNPWQTSFEFRETLMLHLVLTGNAFAFINRVGSERTVRELIPIDPGLVTVERASGGALTYKVRGEGSGEVRTFPAEAIWHLRGPSWNSWLGMPATDLAREAIGLSISLEQGQADFQKNGAKTSGLFSIAESMSKERYDHLREWFDGEAAKTGSYRPLILDRGATYTPFTLSSVDQQLLETRKHQIEEICRAFRVMPLMVGHPADMAARAATESIFIHHVVHTLAPWYRRIEQSAEARLLAPADRAAGLYVRFTPNALMRGASKERAEFYTRALGAGGGDGWMTPNEIRGLEDLNPIEGGDTLPRRADPAGPPSQEDGSDGA